MWQEMLQIGAGGGGEDKIPNPLIPRFTDSTQIKEEKSNVNCSISVSGTYAGYESWNALDRNTNTMWTGDAKGTGTFTVQFTEKPVCVKSFDLQSFLSKESFARILSFDLMASNNGTFTDVFNPIGTYTKADDAIFERFDVDNDTKYSYYRINIKSTRNDRYPVINQLQMQGY